jgi:hypothetical protein
MGRQSEIPNAVLSLSKDPKSAIKACWPALVAGLLALALYAATLAPGLTWAHNGADGGDLLAAALTRGVPHPPGYPTYQLLLRAAIALFPGEPARAGNWLSALCAAAAVALLADLARRTSYAGGGTVGPKVTGQGDRPQRVAVARSETGHSETGHSEGDRPQRVAVARSETGHSERDRPQRVAVARSETGHSKGAKDLVALSAALAWAASPTLWGQAVITEVYALHALAVVALLWLLWRWREALRSGQPGHKWLVAAGLVCGLGLGNHLSLGLMLPGIAVWLWANLTPRPPSLSGKGENGSPSLVRVRVTSLLSLLVAAALGLSVYAYLPLAAAANPPINWGDPDTLPRLWAVVSGKIYRGLLFGVEWRWLPGRLAAWVADALRQFGPWGALIALAGLWRIDRTDHAWWRLTGLTALVYSIYAIGYNTADSYVYLIPAWAVAALWLAAGWEWGLEIVSGGVREQGSKGAESRSALHTPRSTLYVLRVLLAFAIVALPAISVARFWREMDLSHDRMAQEFVESALAVAAPDGVILTASDEPTFALWYAIYGLGRRPDLIPLNVNLYAYPWYQETLAARHPFLVEATGDPNLPLLDQLVAAVAGRRPLYRAEPLNVVLTGYSEQAEGGLVRMMTR